MKRGVPATLVLVAALAVAGAALVSLDGEVPEADAGGATAPPSPAATTESEPTSTVAPSPTASPTPVVTVTPTPTVPFVVGPYGNRVAAGTGPVVGRSGPLLTYTVEVEPATGIALEEVLPVVRWALENRTRGWTAGGAVRFQRIDVPSEADVRVVVATPVSVDANCGAVDLETNGIYSCWDGQRTMLNQHRWERGAADFPDLDQYRTYLVNHEVGHALGHDHVDCPEPGVRAPIMMQQTRSVGACEPNGWPHP